MLKTKNIIIFLILIVLFSAIGVYFAFFRPKASQYLTEVAKLTTLNQTVEATGKVESAQRIVLNFKISGRIKEINIDAGDKVKKGQVLATLDAIALQSRVVDAQAQLATARANYDALIAGASSEDVQVQKDTVTQKKQTLISYENALQNLEQKSAVEIANLKETLLATMGNEIVTARNAIEQINNTLNDDDAKNTLSITNTSALITAKKSQNATNEYINEAEETLNLLSVDSSESDVLAGTDKIKNMLDLTKDALADASNVLLATITSVDLSETALDALKTSIQTQQSAVNAARTGLLTAKANWTNKISYYNDLKVNAQDNIEGAKVALQVTKSQLALKESGPRDFEINAQKAKITQAQAAVTLAQANLEETIIRAPIDGVITKKFFEVGEQTLVSSPVLEMIGQATMEIKANISESDIAKIKTGQITIVTLDALSEEDRFEGVVSFVDVAETVIQDVIYYHIKVQFDTNDERVKPGMTANITILTDKKDNVLVIPFRAIKSRNGNKYVQVLENSGQVIEKTITSGLRGDEGIEITSGLQIGDNVVVFTQE